MTDRVTVSTVIDAPGERVWAMVADLTRMPEWSPENVGVEWRKGATTAVPGAVFSGTNANGSKSWRTTGTVVEAEPGRVLTFRVRAVGMRVAQWTYRFDPTDTGCLVTETWLDERNALLKVLGRQATGVADRATANRAGMEETLARLKAAAEA